MICQPKAVLRRVFCAAMVAGAALWLAACGSLTDAEHMARGKDQLDKGDVRAAAIEFKSALRKNPENPEARFLLGKLYLLEENGPAAEKELQRAQDLKIPLAAMIGEFGQALLLQDKYQDVLDKFPEGVGDDPQQKASVQALRARAYLSLGQKDNAYKAAQAALEAGPESADAALAMARVKALKDGIQEAIQQAAAVTARDKDNVEGWLVLGELQRFSGAYPEAMQSYTQAIGLNPYSYRAYFGRTQAALAAGDLDRAEADARSAFKLVKNHPLAMFLQGVVTVKKGRYEEALSMFEKVAQAVPNFKPVIFWLGVTHAALGHFAQAQDYAANYLKLNPDAAEAHKLMGYVALQQNNPAEAVKVLATLEEEASKDGQLSTLLGTAYMQTGDLDKGVAYLRQAAEAPDAPAAARARYSLALADQGDLTAAQEQIHQAVEADPSLFDSALAVIQKLIQKKEYDQAAKALDDAEERHPKDARIFNLRGGLALSQRKLDEAAKAFQQALDVEPGFPPAAHNLALIALRKGDPDKARDYYQQVIKGYPGHVPTLTALYYLERRQGNNKQAEAWLEKAVEKDEDNPVVTTLLAREYMAQGDALKALTVTEPAAARYPKDEGLLEVRGLAQLQSGQAANALHSFGDLVTARPKAADAYYYRAQAQAALGKAAQTRKDLERALSLDAKHWRAMETLAKLEMNSGHPDKAGKLAAELKKAFPTLPQGWLVHYELAMQQQQYPKAVETMHELIDKGFLSTANVLRLAGAEWAAGNQSEAMDQVKAWLKLHDKDAEALLYMASAEEHLGHAPEAQKYYESVLALQPDHHVALNNLAWLLRDQDSARAQDLAEKAVKLRPDSPALADTLAVILLARGDNQRAVQVLSGFARGGKKDVDPGLRYHYAQALARTGEKGQAKALLTSLTAEEGTFPERAAAQSLLQEISR